MLSRLTTFVTDNTLSMVPRWTYQHVREGDLSFERCWAGLDGLGPEWAGYRLNLHRMNKQDGELFWHPHAWPVATMVLGGPYEMHLGYGGPMIREDGSIDISRPPPRSASIRFDATQGAHWYELVDRGVWHAIRPLGDTWTMMLTAPNWTDWTPSLSPFEPHTIVGPVMVERIQRVFARTPR